MLPPWVLLGDGQLGPSFDAMTAVVLPSIRDPYVLAGVSYPGAIGDGVVDDSAAIRYWLSVNRGFVRAPGPYTYRIASSVPFVNDSTVLVCEPSTVFQLDNGFDAFTLTSRKYCGIVGAPKIRSTALRTSGWAIRSSGGDHADTLGPYPIARAFHYFDVDFEYQTNHILIENDGDGFGDWGTTIGNPLRMMTWTKMGNGDGVRLDTNHGASQFVNPLFMTPDTGKTPAGIHVLATGGATFTGVQGFGLKHNVLVDPAAAMSDSVTLLQFLACQFDVATDDGFHVNLQAGASGQLFINLAGGTWIASSALNGIRVKGAAGSVLKNLQMIGGQIYNNGNYGVKGENGIGTSQIVIDPSVYIANNASGATNYT